MSKGPRMTLNRQKVVLALLQGKRYGFEIASAAGMPTGSVYPVLAWLEAELLVSSCWEENAAHEMGRPRRRYYELTGSGRRAAARVVAETAERIAPVARMAMAA